ncbi:MAG: SGNH/GDSL hydrolase family protein [Eubacteriales bacterium]|nr:SGNH/GDSL hydrolase family protein [Eubacteriales bacterium]
MVNSICVFGDSIIKGIVFDSIRGKYTILENSFANIFARNTKIRVDNYAKFGCTITKGKRIIDKLSDQLAEYKYILLEFGGNDCNLNWPAISERPEDRHDANTPIDEFEKLYSKAIDYVFECGSQPVLFSLPPLDAHKYFNWISKDLNAGNILHWLGDVEYIYRWHEMYNLVVLKLSAIKSVPLIDIRRAFLESKNYQNLYCEDGIHPNEAGHALISNVIKKYAAKII